MVFSRFFAGRGGNPTTVPTTPSPREAPAGVNAGDRIRTFRRDAAQAVASGSLPPESFKRAQDAAIPADPQARSAWIAASIDRTLGLPVTSTVYALTPEFLEALSRHVEKDVDLEALARAPEGFCMAFERMASGHASRCAWFAAGPERALARIAIETEALRDASHGEIAARFERTPAARVDPIPATDVALRDWLSDMLHGEAAAISAGLVPPADAIRAAFLSNLPVEHARPADGSRIPLAFRAFHPALHNPSRHADRTGHLSGLARETVMARFADVPGFEARAARTWAIDDWRALIAEALLAEEIRVLSGLAVASGPAEEVELTDVVLADGGAGFAATLHVFGERVCRIACDAEGEMVADEWSEGCSVADLDALDAYVTATGEPRDGGTTPDTLAMRIMDIVLTHAMVAAYREASVGNALFAVHQDGGVALHKEPIDHEEDRERVVRAFASHSPGCIPLDSLDEIDAAELWMTLNGPA